MALSASVKVTKGGLLPQTYGQTMDRGVFKSYVAPGSIAGCSGSPACSCSAELNTATLAPHRAHDPSPWLSLAYAQHSVIGKSTRFSPRADPTGFLPQDCVQGPWGERRNRCRIDEAPPPSRCNDPPKLSHAGPFSHHTGGYLDSRFITGQPSSASRDQSDRGLPTDF